MYYVACISPATSAVRLNCSAIAPLPSRRLLIGFETRRPIGCPARRSCDRYVPRIAEVTAFLRMNMSAVASQGGGDTDVKSKADRCCHLRACTIKTISRLHAIMRASPRTHSLKAIEEAVMRRRSRIHGCTVVCEHQFLACHRLPAVAATGQACTEPYSARGATAAHSAPH